MAKRVAGDGEGASKFISIKCKNAKTEEDAKNNFDAIQKELTVEVIPQHKTHQLFLATKLGSKKSDSLFRAGKKELKEAGITEDSEDYNAKLLDKVISLAEKPLFNKYGKTQRWRPPHRLRQHTRRCRPRTRSLDRRR